MTEADRSAIAAVAARLDLRRPNREALESLALEFHDHFDRQGKPAPFECVLDLATGVGKTYILAAAMDYLYLQGIRNFAVITPGRTILEKTEANFSVGHPKSLLPALESRPVAITAKNFKSPATRATMDNERETKLFVFTIQALLKPTSDAGRKTHKFQEGLGKAFYEHLAGLKDLVVFADEHHCYFGKAFTIAVRDLCPRAIIGLTATPHRSTPKDQIIYRYPLAAAIAERYVKTPVIVGRKDDRADARTKLADGARLLDLKQSAIDEYCRLHGLPRFNALMLVVAQDIAEANEFGSIVREPSFCGGRFADPRSVLVVHSDSPDAALHALESVEDPASPVRIIVSVGKLKEGWDVKSVYVIASMRASVSEILTEQTLGRGLRLPFGAYTNNQFLDTVEVLAHERYEDLLRKSEVLNESFVDFETRARERIEESGRFARAPNTPEGRPSAPPETAEPLSIESLDARDAVGTANVAGLKVELKPRTQWGALMVPRLIMRSVESKFTLQDITDYTGFRALGERLAAAPSDELRRTLLDAKVIEGGGARRTELVRKSASDRIESQAARLPLPALIEELTTRVLEAEVVPARKDQRDAVKPIVEAFLVGLGDAQESILNSFLERAARALVAQITVQHKKFTAKPQYVEVIELIEFSKLRSGRPETSEDIRTAKFVRNIGYTGWSKSFYDQVWFDSNPEGQAASILDSAKEIKYWVRLHINDLPILWHSDGNEYNPDFIVVDGKGVHYIVEIKGERDIASDAVAAKREAATRWANYVSADPKVGCRWRYLFLSESDVTTAAGSWTALKKLGGG